MMYSHLRWVSFAEIVSRISSVVITPLLTNALLPADYGLFKSIPVVVGTLLILQGIPNLGFLIQKTLPEIDNEQKKGGLISAVTLTQTVLVISSAIALVFAARTGLLDILSPKVQTIINQHLELGLVYIASRGISRSLMPVLKGLDAYRLFSGVRLFRELSLLIVIIGLVATGNTTVITVLGVYAFVNVGVVVISSALLGRLLLSKPDLTQLYQQFRAVSLPLVPRTFVKAIEGKASNLLVLTAFGEVTFAIWTIIFAFTNVFQLFSKPFTEMSISKISEKIDNERAIDMTVRRYYKTMVLLCSPILLGGWLVGPQLVRYVFGQEYVISPVVFGAFLFAFGVQSVDAINGGVFIGSGESARETIRYSVGVGIKLLFVVLGTLVIKSLLLIAVGYVLENSLRFGLSIWYNRDRIPLSMPSLDEIAQFGVVLSVMGIVVASLEGLIGSPLTLFTVIGCGAIVYFGGLMMSNVVKDEELALVRSFTKM